VTTALPGEPAGSALAGARLEASSCNDLGALAKRQAARRIAIMRKEVDASFEDWHAAQPDCWAMYRSRAANGGTGQGFGSGHGRLGGSHSAGARGISGRAARRPRKAQSASGTNVQVASVDEADIVKHDGRYVYLVMNGALRIVQALDPKITSVTKLPGRVRDLFLEGDRVVVYTSSGGGQRAPCTYGYDCVYAGDGSSTSILVYDVSERSAPQRVREIGLSGSLIAARRIGNAVHTVVSDGDSDEKPYETWPADLETCGFKEAYVKKRFLALKRENEKKILASSWLPVISDNGKQRPLCDNLYTASLAQGDAMTTLVSFDMADDRAPAVTATLFSRPGPVFASEDALYVSVTNTSAAEGRTLGRSLARFRYAPPHETTGIHKFRIGELPSSTRYVGSGVVPGHVLNQFSLDQYYGYLRIATTRGRVPEPNVVSSLSILRENEQGNMVRVGAIEGIAPGEDIRSVRFDEDRAYVVTFKKTDPLFVLDLWDAAKPRVLGELKIPGFSTYLHRIDRDHLLSIGFDADENGSFAYFDGIILQLFDVSAPTDPKLLHKEKLGTRGSSSEAATNHLAFNYFAEKGLLALPITVCEGGGDGRNGSELTFSGLYVYEVSVARGFSRLGGIDHGKSGVHCRNWWSQGTSTVKRSLFLDDLVYSLAADRLKVQRMGSFGKDIADIALAP
jgi:hypothetical protein